MTKNDIDDERFRQELIAHGIPTRDAAPLTGDGARAAVQLARILALPHCKPTLLRRIVRGVSGWTFRRLGLIIVASIAAIVASSSSSCPRRWEARFTEVELGALPASGESWEFAARPRHQGAESSVQTHTPDPTFMSPATPGFPSTTRPETSNAEKGPIDQRSGVTTPN